VRPSKESLILKVLKYPKRRYKGKNHGQKKRKKGGQIFFAASLIFYLLVGTPAVHANPSPRSTNPFPTPINNRPIVNQDLNSAYRAWLGVNDLNYRSHYNERYRFMYKQRDILKEACANIPLPDLNFLLTPDNLDQKMPILKMEFNLLDKRDRRFIDNLSIYKDKADQLMTEQESNLNRAIALMKEASEKCKHSKAGPQQINIPKANAQQQLRK